LGLKTALSSFKTAFVGFISKGHPFWHMNAAVPDRLPSGRTKYLIKMEEERITVRLAKAADINFVKQITDEMEASAIARRSGISKRSPESICEKILDGKAVIALTNQGKWVGFQYLEVWEAGKFVSNSGLIVSPEYRNAGIATAIKNKIFQLSRMKYPNAGIFSITTGLAIMKMNTALGFEPVTYSEITKDEHFWDGCKSCVNYDVLTGKKRFNCLCTAMLFDPAKQPKPQPHQMIHPAMN
jgi:N-acetylglutamate synthase-like GNAT family acetyltransferase